MAEVPLDSFKEFVLNAKGLPGGGSFDAVSGILPPSDEGSVAADGLAVVSNRGDDSTGADNELYFQRLDENGKPVGDPTPVASFADIESVDVTSALDQGKRFVVYVVDSGTKPDDKIFLQVMSADGKKVGSKININTPPDRQEDNQNVAIDPLGRFLLFTQEGSKFGCPLNDILMYQALNSNGTKRGGAKVLVSCGLVSDDIINLDVLPE